MQKRFTLPKLGTAMTACILLLYFMLFSPEPAHAYLNPGSNSTAIKWIIAGIATVSRMKAYAACVVNRLMGK